MGEIPVSPPLYETLQSVLSLSGIVPNFLFLPKHASEHGNVIGSVRIYYIYIYICVCVYKKIVIERTRDLIYLKFVATDFFPKIISLSAGENSGDLA